jgi:hypothetical protein
MSTVEMMELQKRDEGIVPPRHPTKSESPSNVFHFTSNFDVFIESWTVDEDQKLIELINKHGTKNCKGIAIKTTCSNFIR